MKSSQFLFIFLVVILSACNNTSTTTLPITTEDRETTINQTTNHIFTPSPTFTEELTSETTIEIPSTSIQTSTNPTTASLQTQTPTPTQEATNEPTTVIPTTESHTTEATERTTPQYIMVVIENMQGATGTTVLSGIKGNPFFLPEEPMKQGHVFDGWYMDASFQTPINLTIYPDNDISVYVKWLRLTQVSFDSNNGTSTSTNVLGLAGETIHYPINPTWSGYIFDGWYIDQTYTLPFTLTVFPNDDITVYAKWIEETTSKDEMIAILETNFGFICQNNICELQESSISYTFNLNDITFTKSLIDNDTSGDEQIKTETVVIDQNWDVEYNISITYLSTQKASMRVTGNALTENYTIRNFSSNYLSENNLYEDALQFIDDPYGAGAKGFLEYILEVAEMTLDDLSN